MRDRFSPFDRPQAERYLNLLYGELLEGGGFLCLGSLDADGHWKDEHVSSVREALDFFASPRARLRSLYVRQAVYVEPSGKKTHARTTRVLFADCDGAPADFAAKLAGSPLPAPSMIVHTGGGVHYYWLLAASVEFRDEFDVFVPGCEKFGSRVEVRTRSNQYLADYEARLKGIRDALGSDPAATDAGRQLRIPGSWNYLDPKKRAAGRTEAPCDLIECHPERVYKLEDFPAGERGHASSGASASAPTEAAVEDVVHCLKQLDPVKHHHYLDWLHVGMEVHSATGGSAEGLAAWTEWSLRDPREDTVEACEAKWPSFDASRAGGRTVASLYQRVRDVGGTLPPRRGAAEEFDELTDEEPDAKEPQADYPPLKGTGLTDTANALRYALDHKNRARFVEELESWIVWDEHRWALDVAELRVQELAGETARGIEQAANAVTDVEARGKAYAWAIKSHSRERRAAMVELARPHLKISIRELDADPLLLNVKNGTVDLRTGELLPHDPKRLITKIAPTKFDPKARCPKWEKFLADVLLDAAVRAAFQRFMGYTLQGGQEAKAFAIGVGPGDGGKSTAVKAVTFALGSDAGGGAGAVCHAYVANTKLTAFRKRDEGGNSPETARLVGARLAVVSDLAGTLDAAPIKAWTGGDPVTGMPKYGHEFSFYPDATPILVGNVMPELDFEDDALWERVVVFPFDKSIPEKDRIRDYWKQFELEGVLAWLVEGHRLYRERGLDVPEACRAARATRRAEVDPLADFWSCVVEQGGEGVFLSTGTLFAAYQQWAYREGLQLRQHLTRRQFTPKAEKRFGTLQRDPKGDDRGWRGLTLLVSASTAADDFLGESQWVTY